MKNKKYLPIIGLIAVLACSFMPFATALVYEMSYCALGTINHVTLGYITDGSIKEATGQSIAPTTSLFLSSAQFSIQRIGNPTGVLTAGLYNHSNKVLLENSTTFLNTGDIGTLGHEWYTFTFSETYNLTVGITYIVMLKLESGYSGFTSSNNINVGFDLSSGAPNGPGYGYRLRSSGVWEYETLWDCAHYIYGTDGVTSTPTPTAYPTYDPDDTDGTEVMNDLISYGVPVVVMLLPVLFIWLIGGRGKWPFMMGIAIGTGTGYLFGLVPVWLVFLVSIAEVGMAYQSVRSGN